jgi:magnesium transporter
MARKRRHHGLPTNPGRSPGTLEIPEGAAAPRIRLTRYSAAKIETRERIGAAEVAAFAEGDDIAWLEVEGFGSREVLQALEKRFRIPRLALEDVLGNSARPKVDSHDEALFVIARAARSSERAEFEQVSIFLRGRTLITFTDESLDVFKALRERLKDPSSLTRSSQVDFLLYRVLDTVVDSYVPCLESLGARLDAVEAEAIQRPSSRPLQTLYLLMRDLRQMTRIALPMREVASSLLNEGKPHFQPSTLPFLFDLRDHTQGLVELSSHYRDLGTDVRELIIGALNLRMNQVMRLLTAITSIFIPLSFVTGVYGMNFEHMPETRWTYGYLAVMVVLAVAGYLIYRKVRSLGWTKVGDE